MGNTFDIDQITEASANLVVGGTTLSKSMLLGKPVNSCLDRGVPFLMKYSDGVRVWEKYFPHEVYSFSIGAQLNVFT